MEVMKAIASEKDDDNSEEGYEVGGISHSCVDMLGEDMSNISDIFYLITPEEKTRAVLLQLSKEIIMKNL